MSDILYGNPTPKQVCEVHGRDDKPLKMACGECLEELEQQLKAAETELTELKAEHDTMFDAMLELEKDNQTLRDLLALYGGHEDDCESRLFDGLDSEPCTCDWNEVWDKHISGRRDG